MDGQNFQNGQNEQNGQSTQNIYTQGTNNYQDNTAQYGSMYSNPVVEEPADNATPSISIAGLVMGIVSIVLMCCCGSGIIFAIPGLIMSIIGNKQTKTGVGTAGLVCSIVGIVLNILSIIYWVLSGALAMMDM